LLMLLLTNKVSKNTETLVTIKDARTYSRGYELVDV
jgi:hypothetical protein